jgi:hypothetical protein
MSQADPLHFRAEEWSAYVDGEVAALRRDAMRAHAARCPQCAAILQRLEQVQRDVEELARTAGPPPSRDRAPLLAEAARLLARQRSARRWWVALVTLVAVLGWYGWMSVPPSRAPRLSVEQIVIARYFLEPTVLEYDVSIRNPGRKPLRITAAVMADPLGTSREPVQPPLEIAPRTAMRHVFNREVPETGTRLPGRYRIELETSAGRLVAERVLAAGP